MDEQELLKAEWAAVRNKREQLLRACDYTQLPDSPLSESQRAEMAVYRQALRDITETHSEPWNITWPVAPSF
jgi:predicted metal-dependent hydrolase